MPNRNSATVKYDLVNFAYTKAYLSPPNWKEVFTEKTCQFLLYSALCIGSRPEFVIGLLFLAVSSLMGPNARLKADTGELLRPNLFIFLVGHPRTGKTPAYFRYMQHPFCKVQEELMMSKKLLYQSFTSAGLLAHLCQNEGHGLVCADEVCHELIEYFGTGMADSVSMRRNLNNFWSGHGHDKVYKGGAKRQIKFPGSYFSMGGTTQPDVFCMLLCRILFPNDGLQDRMLVLCANPRKSHPNSEVDDTKFYSLSDNWVEQLYRNVYKSHRETIVYKLSPEASDFISNVRRASDEHRDDQLRDFEKAVSREGTSYDLDDCSLDNTSAPDLSNDSKDVDYVLKLATLIHVIEYYVNLFQTSGVIETALPPGVTISLGTIKGAYHLVSKMRCQFDELKQCIKPPNTDDGPGSSSGTRASASGSPEMVGKQLDVINLICAFPGPVVSSRLLARKFKGRRPKPTAMPILECMQSTSKAVGDPDFYGIHKSNGNQHLWYKAPPALCDFDFLQRHGVTRNQYIETYSADVQHTVPVCNVYETVDEWQKTLNGWLADTPEELKQHPE